MLGLIAMKSDCPSEVCHSSLFYECLCNQWHLYKTLQASTVPGGELRAKVQIMSYISTSLMIRIRWSDLNQTHVTVSFSLYQLSWGNLWHRMDWHMPII